MVDNADKSAIFLTVAEAVQAVCIDFRQYPPQTLLFAGIIDLISNNTIHLKREAGQDGAWINRVGKQNMQWLDGPELIEFMCRIVSDADWDTDLAAVLCSRVFQTRATPVPPDDNHEGGVRIETHMENFSCRQCGKCCRTLNYRNELTPQDISRWRSGQRHDILKWVDTAPRQDPGENYSMWVSPKTRRPLDTCPFLEKDPTSNRWQCRIQDVKPGICRQYPSTRKHAIMTGCLGFKPEDK